ncbi:TetR/AcrR family transcriptional regulator [Polynucleobacter sp. JS-Fieb-80-E5]|uniref:TetR/AcrR family transcriptional regulator n=1 Tax=Polynucleobacter sp. JS-Fieb-80-E5 TaxID=2081050 RepID=UPI001C0CB7CE|nr:TetR/AcrR family transcriptional regulator [Polynucleobacter sp. JS-Fieb-80-E5]MBU3618561.1 TetR/AcrR family transcriptional regulator [Polynucleobacter sp. JS-Fieb-80-E5]
MAKALDHRVRVAALRREEMQLHLLFSGLTLASTNSIHDLEVEDVIRQADVSRGSFYNYFPSLPALYDGLAKQLMQEFADLISASMPPSVDTVTRLASTMRILMRLVVDFPMLGRFLTQIQWPSQNPDSEIFQNIIRDIQLGIKERSFANMPASIGANIAIGSLIGGIYTMLLKRPAKGFEDQVTNQVLIGLGIDAKSASKISQLPLLEKLQLPETGIFGKLAEMGALAKK